VIAVGILGPLSLTVDGRPVPVSAAKVRIILACLVLRNGQVVSVDELTDRLWASVPPKNARNAVQTYVRRLRAVLGGSDHLVRTMPHGYQIDLPPGALDVERFRGHVERARAAAATGDLGEEARELAAGLAVARGRPLSDVPSEVVQRDDVPRLVEEQLQARERRLDIDLRLGRHADVLGELGGLIDEHPLREPLWGQLMLALWRSGRRADALNAYRQLAALLRDELGVEPGPSIRERYEQIVAGEPMVESLASPERQSMSVAPFQLPGEPAHFIGRARLVDRLRVALSPSARTPAAAQVIVLSGPPGVGKTALAIHVARQLGLEFPDGQLYTDLRGFSSSSPVPATDAAAQLLRALGTGADQVPAALDERSALLRSLLAGRRVLLVLDNAIRADQVRPLLPGHRGSAVIVTSRDMLSGLSAVNGAMSVPVSPLAPDEALAILADGLGSRVAGEREAAVELASECGNLPLALRIAAANLAAMPGHRIATYVTRLRHESRWSALEIEGDEEAAVGRAFDLSYATLTPELARTFDHLGLMRGPDFDAYAVANLTGVDLPRARAILHRLATSNLIHNHTADRYQFYDLIGDYARSRILRDYEPSSLVAPYRRLFDFYLHAAGRMAGMLYPDILRLPVPPAPPDLVIPESTDFAAALQWFESERANLEAMIREPAPGPTKLPVWLLADAALGYLDRQGLDDTLEACLRVARAGARRNGDARAEAAMSRALGKLCYLSGRYPESREYLMQSGNLYRQLADPVGEARVLTVLGGLETGLDDYARAIEHWQAALRAHRLAADSAGEADTRSNLGTAMILLGRGPEGGRHLVAAEEIAGRLGLHHIRPRATSAIALNDLWSGRLADALRGFGDALEEWRSVGYRIGVAQTLRNMAEVRLECGSVQSAHALVTEALTIADGDRLFWNVAGAHVTLGWIALELDDHASAAAHFGQARSLPPAGLRYWAAFASLGLATCRRLAGDHDAATELAGQALRDSRPRVQGGAHRELARIHLAVGGWSRAAGHAGRAADVARRHGYRLDEARALEVGAELRGRTP
jgi:DNA-binding SARP family transcriptional activator/tetratricopeptide (TPR) repeat protein